MIFQTFVIKVTDYASVGGTIGTIVNTFKDKAQQSQYVRLSFEENFAKKIVTLNFKA